jgi:hypothetical protein
MSVDLAAAVWEELKRYIGTLDRTEAADAMVNLLIDSNFDSDEIRDAFKGDPEIKKELNAYISDRSDDEEEFDDEDADVDEYDDDEDY